MRENRKIEKIISNAYFNPRHKGSYGGKTRLASALAPKVAKSTVNKWLEETDTYNLHAPVRRKFPRRKYVVTGLDHLIQMDIAVFTNFSKYNDNFKYLLVIIDVFSRKGYVIPLKTKSALEVSTSIDQFLKRKSPLYCQTDKGSEFVNKHTQRVFAKHNVHHYTYTNQEIKASYVERFTRTLKQRIYRYFTHNNTYRYIDALPSIVESYNSSTHSSHKMIPNQINHINQEEVWQTLYNPDKPNMSEKTQYKFNVGDKVRISKHATMFSKGYLPAWSEEIFTISKRHGTTPVVYSLEDANKDKLIGTWYEQELQRVHVKDDTYKIEKIISQRKVNGKQQYLVKWLGYGPSFNSYVNKSDLVLDYKN